jgi:hypothetical protein
MWASKDHQQKDLNSLADGLATKIAEDNNVDHIGGALNAERGEVVLSCFQCHLNIGSGGTLARAPP